MKYAVVTGASKGIGKAIAYELAKKGFHLILGGRNLYDLKQVAESIHREFEVDVRFVAVDLADPKGAEKLFHWVIEQKVDVRILVNNAGAGLVGRFEKYSPEQYQKMVQLNCTSLISLTNYFYPALLGKGEAYVLNIASSSAYQAVPYLTVYAATKSLVVSFSRAIRLEWKRRGVSVTVVSPGPTISHFNESANVSERADKIAKKLSMTAEAVAKKSVQAMFKRQPEKVIGWFNQFGAVGAKFLPKSWVEKVSILLYQ